MEQGQQRFGVSDTLDVFIEKNKKYNFKVRVLVWIQGLVASHARLIITPSDYLKGIVKCWGISEEKIHTIYSALFPLTVSESKDEVREMLNYEGLVLVTAGRLVPWKGIDTLISLVEELHKEVGTITLVIAGDGPLLQEYKKQADALGVSDYVRFVGNLPKDTLGRAIKGADVFVLNSSYEGMSHQLLEVMDLGVPIVTTDVGGNPEHIVDGVTGFLVPYNDKEALLNAIMRLHADKKLSAEITERAKLRVRDFEKKKVVNELVAVLKGIL